MANFTKTTKIMDGKVGLGVTDIIGGTLTVDGGNVPEGLTVDLRAGTVEWTDQGTLGAPGPYTFAGQHRTPEETATNEATYREKRAVGYITTISPEGTFQMSVGDVCDALIKMCEFLAGNAGVNLDTETDPRAVEFKTLLDQVNVVKATYPKPG